MMFHDIIGVSTWKIFSVQWCAHIKFVTFLQIFALKWQGFHVCKIHFITYVSKIVFMWKFITLQHILDNSESSWRQRMHCWMRYIQLSRLVLILSFAHKFSSEILKWYSNWHNEHIESCLNKIGSNKAQRMHCMMW